MTEISVRAIRVTGRSHLKARQEITALRNKVASLRQSPNPELGRAAEEIQDLVNNRIADLKQKGIGVDIQVVCDGQIGFVRARLSDMPPELLQHVLFTDVDAQGVTHEAHVRLSDRAVAQRLIGSHPEILQRFVTSPEQPIDWGSLPFDLNRCDAMLSHSIDTSKGEGWETLTDPDMAIYPFCHYPISPAAAVLHYGPAVFEGAKARRTADGRIIGFRWDENFKRLNRGLRRLGMTPAQDPNLFIQAARHVVLANEHLLPPAGSGATMYVRPFVFADGPVLGVKIGPKQTLGIFASPVGPYFPNPAKLLTETIIHRAGVGGLGEIKAAGNYVTGMIAAMVAKDRGYTEILWLDAENKYIEEVGAANIFVIDGQTINTPELNGRILPGITRDSVIQIARAMGFTVYERPVPLSSLMLANEVFCTGTAAGIHQVAGISHGGADHPINKGEMGPITKQLKAALAALQEARFDDPILRSIRPDKLAEFRDTWITVVAA